MPELEINLDALAHNLRLVRRQEQAWGFRFLPGSIWIISARKRQAQNCLR